MIEVPRPASRSIRRRIMSSGTGSEVLSYSLQYRQDRLQRRIGTMCARIRGFVESSPRAIYLASQGRVAVLFFGFIPVDCLWVRDQACFGVNFCGVAILSPPRKVIFRLQVQNLFME